MENIKGNTTSGDAVQSNNANPAPAASSPSLPKNAKIVTKNAPCFGTQTERFEILRQALLDYQKAGGRVEIRYRNDVQALVVVLVNIPPEESTVWVLPKSTG